LDETAQSNNRHRMANADQVGPRRIYTKVSIIDSSRRRNLPQVSWSIVRFPTHCAVGLEGKED
jgi:hypothetical protein